MSTPPTRPRKRLRTKTPPTPEPDAWTITAVLLSGSYFATVSDVWPLTTVKRLSKAFKREGKTDQVLQLVFGDEVLQDQTSLVEAGLYDQATLQVILVGESLLAVIQDDGKVKIFNAQTGDVSTMHNIAPCLDFNFIPFTRISDMTFQQHQKIVLMAQTSREALVYMQDFASGAQKKVLPLTTRHVTSSCLSQDGSLVAAGDVDGFIGICNINDYLKAGDTDASPFSIRWQASRAPPNRITKLLLSPKAKFVASNCDHDNTVVLWCTETGKRLRTFRQQRDLTAVWTFSFSPSGDILAIVTVEENDAKCFWRDDERPSANALGVATPIELWSIADGVLLKVLRGRVNPASDTFFRSSICFSPQGDLLVVSTQKAGVDVFDLQQKTHTFLEDRCPLHERALVFTADGDFLALASFGCWWLDTPRIWCTTTWTRKRGFEPEQWSNTKGAAAHHIYGPMLFGAVRTQ